MKGLTPGMSVAAALAMATSAQAVVVDGSIAGDGYGAPHAVQTNETRFGDNSSELNAGYGFIDPGNAIPNTIAVDLDLDGTVSCADRNTLQANLGQTNLGWADGDIDGSGPIDQTDLLLANLLQGGIDGDSFVGIDDLNAVLANWNAGTPPGAPGAPNSQSNIPEPGTLALLSLAFALIQRRR